MFCLKMAVEIGIVKDGRFGQLCVADGGQELLLVKRLGYLRYQNWVLMALWVYVLVPSIHLTVVTLVILEFALVLSIGLYPSCVCRGATRSGLLRMRPSLCQ